MSRGRDESTASDVEALEREVTTIARIFVAAAALAAIAAASVWVSATAPTLLWGLALGQAAGVGALALR